MAVVPEQHRLAPQDTVRLADLDGETMPQWPEAANRDGKGPFVHDTGQVMQLISLGRIVAVLPESVRGRLHSGLAGRPVADAPTATIVLAWPRQSTSPDVAAFARAASTAADRHHADLLRAEPATMS